MPISAKYNDCLVHAVNCALRFPWFRTRQQVLRLMKRRMKQKLIDVEATKVEQGVPFRVMRDFYLLKNGAKKRNISYSLKLKEAVTMGGIKLYLMDTLIPDLLG